uniref:Peptidase S1 domain-containing protein n=1 Tax=Ailuropoda melanoleuca TaxID=9646 RepID=A0A7N5JEJ1_AILME
MSRPISGPNCSANQVDNIQYFPGFHFSLITPDFPPSGLEPCLLSSWSAPISTLAHSQGEGQHRLPVLRGLPHQRGLGGHCRPLWDQVCKNPKFNMVTVRSDIALLKLATPACFSHTMSPMCLPETTDEFPPGLVCATTGWGRTKYNAHKTPDKLQQAALPPAQNPGWGRSGHTGAPAPCFRLGNKSFLLLQGDSGGPLVCQKDGAWTLVGIVSWSSSICFPSIPAVFPREPASWSLKIAVLG